MYSILCHFLCEELIRTFGAKCDSAELSQVYAYKFDLISTLSWSNDLVKGLVKHFLDAKSWYSGAMLWRRVSARQFDIVVACTKSVNAHLHDTAKGTEVLTCHTLGPLHSQVGPDQRSVLSRPKSFQAGAGRDAPRL